MGRVSRAQAREKPGQGGGRRGGLAILADRAAALGGEFSAGRAEGGGTVLMGRVPPED